MDWLTENWWVALFGTITAVAGSLLTGVVAIMKAHSRRNDPLVANTIAMLEQHRKDAEHLLNRVQQLEAGLDALRKENTELKIGMASMREELQDVEKENAQLKQECASLRERCERLESENERLRQEVEE